MATTTTPRAPGAIARARRTRGRRVDDVDDTRRRVAARDRAIARATPAIARTATRTIVAVSTALTLTLGRGVWAEEAVVGDERGAEASAGRAEYVPSAAPSLNGDALAAYERATRTGGNSNAAKSLVGGKKSSSRSWEGGAEKSADAGAPVGALAAIPVIGGGAFAAFKALSGGSSEDDDDEDVTPKAKRGTPVNVPKVEKPKTPAPEAAEEKKSAFSMPKMGTNKRLPPDAPRANFPKRSEIWAEEFEAEAAAEEEDEVSEAAEREERESRRAAREAERELEKAEREAARAQRDAEREAEKAMKEQEEEQRAAAKAQAKRDRSAEEADAAARKQREKQLIEMERAQIKAAKAARAEQKKAERETQKQEREARAAARKQARLEREEARRAEREARSAGTQLLRPNRDLSASEERSFTQFFKKPAPNPTEAPSVRSLAKTQAMKKGKAPTGAESSSTDVTLPSDFPTVADLQGLEKEEKLELAAEAEAFAERLAVKADAAEKFASGPVVSFIFFLKPGAVNSAERARAVADLAAGEAAQVRATAERGDFPVAGLIGAIAATALAGGAALLVSSGDVPATPSIPKIEAPKVQRAAPSMPSMPNFFAQSKEAPPVADAPLRDVAAMEAVEKLQNGQGDALDLYEMMSRR